MGYTSHIFTAAEAAKIAKFIGSAMWPNPDFVAAQSALKSAEWSLEQAEKYGQRTEDIKGWIQHHQKLMESREPIIPIKGTAVSIYVNSGGGRCGGCNRIAFYWDGEGEDGFWCEPGQI